MPAKRKRYISPAKPRRKSGFQPGHQHGRKFQPGNQVAVGNKGGLGSRKPVTQALISMLHEAERQGAEKTKLWALIDKLYKRAMRGAYGDLEAMVEIMNRVDGRPIAMNIDEEGMKTPVLVQVNFSDPIEASRTYAQIMKGDKT